MKETTSSDTWKIPYSTSPFYLYAAMINAEVIEDNLSSDPYYDDIVAQDSSFLDLFYQLYVEDDNLQPELSQFTVKDPATSRVPAFSSVSDQEIREPPFLPPPFQEASNSLPNRLTFPQNLLGHHSKRSMWSCSPRCFDSNFPQRHLPNHVNLASPFILPLSNDKVSLVNSDSSLERGQAVLGAYYPHYYFHLRIDMIDVVAQQSLLDIRQHNQSSLHRGFCCVEEDWRAVQGSCPSWHQQEGWKLVYPYKVPRPLMAEKTKFSLEFPSLSDDVKSLLLKVFGLLVLISLVTWQRIKRPKSSKDRSLKESEVSLPEELSYIKDQIARRREELQRQQQLLLQKKLDRTAKRRRVEKVPELHELYVRSGKTSPPSVNNPLFTSIYRQRDVRIARDLAESFLDDTKDVKPSQASPNNPTSPPSTANSSTLSSVSSPPPSPRKILSLQRIKYVEVHSPASNKIPLTHDATLAVSSSTSSDAFSTFPECVGEIAEEEEEEEEEGEKVEEEIKIEIEIDEEEDNEVESSVRSSPLVDFTEIYPFTSKEELVPLTLNPFPTTPNPTTTRIEDPHRTSNANNVSGDGKTSREESNDSYDSDDASSVEIMMLVDVLPPSSTEKEENDELNEEENENVLEIESEDDDEQNSGGEAHGEEEIEVVEAEEAEEIEAEADDMFASQSVKYEQSLLSPQIVTSDNLVEEEVSAGGMTSLPLGSPSLFVWRYRAAPNDDVTALEVTSVGDEEVVSKDESEVIHEKVREKEEIGNVATSLSPSKWRESRYKLDKHLLLTPPRNSLPPLPQTLPQAKRHRGLLPPLDHLPNTFPFPSNTLLSDDLSFASQSTASSLSVSSAQPRSLKQVKEEFIRRATSSSSSRSVSPSSATTSSSSAAPLPIHSRATDVPLISLENTIVRSFRTKYDLLKNVSLLQQRYNICFPRRYSPASLTSPTQSKGSSLIGDADNASSPNKGGKRCGLLSPPSPAIYIRHERDLYEKLHSPRRALRGVRSDRRSSISTSSSDPMSVQNTDLYQTPLKLKSSDRRRASLVTKSVDRFNFRLHEQNDDVSENARSVLAKSYDDISVEEILDLRKGFDRDFYQRLITSTATSSTSVPLASSSNECDIMRGTEASRNSHIKLINSTSNVHTYSYDNKADVAPPHYHDSDSDNDTVSYDDLRQRQRQHQERS